MKRVLIFFFCFMVLGPANLALGQVTRTFIFGHSLLDHRPPLQPTTPDETTVPHWFYLLCQAAGKQYEVAGQYGFLPQHQNLPPVPQWGYQQVPGAWDSDVVPDFSDANFNSAIITAGNFMQWQPPHFEYPGDPGVSPVSATRNIMDWLEVQEDSMRIYIYENWPDMAGFLTNGDLPPLAADFNNYNNYTRNEFHEWWISYHDSLLVTHSQVKMIPVGPIIAGLMQDSSLNAIPFFDLYEDDAPHGRPNIYFLAALITYMGMYQEMPPASFTLPSSIHPTIQNNYSGIVNYIWDYLQSFETATGQSRVFFSTNPTEPAAGVVRVSGGSLFIDHAEGFMLRGKDGNCYLIYVDEQGVLVHEVTACP